MANTRDDQDQNIKKNKEIFEYAREILAYASAVPIGVAKGLYSTIAGVLQAVAHPIDNVIYPISELLYDATVISAAHSIHVPNSIDPFFGEMEILRHLISNNPQIYIDSANRMQQKIDHLAGTVQTFSNASGPIKVEMLAEGAALIFSPGWIIRSAKVASELHKLNKILADPPLFRNPIEYKVTPNAPAINKLPPNDIKNIKDNTTCLYVITEDRELIVALEEYKYKSLYGNEYLCSLNHHNLTLKRVSSAGEVIIEDGNIIRIDNESGHFLPHGEHLESHVVSTFKQNGFKGVEGKFIDTHPDVVVPHQSVMSPAVDGLLGSANLGLNMLQNNTDAIGYSISDLFLSNANATSELNAEREGQAEQAAAAERQRQTDQAAAAERQRQAEQAAAAERQRQAEQAEAEERQRQAEQSKILNSIHLPNSLSPTTNIHTLYINGEEKIFAMICQSQGLEVHSYNLKTNTWQRLPCGSLWKDVPGSIIPAYMSPEHYETIRTNVITVNGQQKILAMIRDEYGVKLHQYDPINNAWQRLANGPLWANGTGYACEGCYKSVRTEVITVNGQQKLLAMILESGGLALHQYDPETNLWNQLAKGKSRPAWSYDHGFFKPTHYETIRTNVITVNGQQKLLAMIRTGYGVDLHQYDPLTDSWAQQNGYIPWADSTGYACVPCYKTVRTEVMTIDGQQKLLAMILCSGGLELHQYDLSTQIWTQLPGNPAWPIDTIYWNPKYYETLSTAIMTRNGQQTLLAMIRNEHGVELHQFDPNNKQWALLPENQPQVKQAENLIKITFKKVLSQIDQRQAEQKAAEERQRQAAAAAAAAIAEYQRQQAYAQQQAFFAAQQQAAAAQQAAQQKAIAQRQWYANAMEATQANFNASMAAHQQSMQALNKPFNPPISSQLSTFTPPTIFNLQQEFEKNKQYANDFLKRNAGGSSSYGGPGLFSSNNNSSCAKTWNDVAKGLPICIAKKW